MRGINHKKKQRLLNLLEEIRSSKRSNFYKQMWNTPLEFLKLPQVSLSDFVEVPLHKRTYESGKGLVKLAYNKNVPFLVKWDLANLAEENYGTVTHKRPFVLLKNRHEAVEKSLWFYEHNILPAVGETNNLSVAVYTASTYEINALVTDTTMLLSFLPLLEKKYELSAIQSCTIIDSSFVSEDLDPFLKKFASIRLVLALPETGAFAESCPEALQDGEILFHPDKNSIVEFEDTLVVTKLLLLPTPIIRYKTVLVGKTKEKECACAEPEAFSVNT